MTKIKLLFLFPFFYYYCFANNITINQNELNLISNDKMWQKLLHIKNKKSEIISNDFFISKEKNHLYKKELIETINAYTSNNLKKDNTHPLCKYPARYHWLSKKLDFINYEVPNYCTHLKKWSVYKNTQSISLMLVSGYLGNPASTFGHSFIKLNSKEAQNTNNLFDLSLNFGALVPDNEAIIKYIFKGIFGGYEAGFSDKYFYTQDLIYSHNEFRDIWDYELNLNTFEKQLIVFHLWEIVGKKFKYYFLDKNCAYRVSEIIELIKEEPIIQNAKYWYAPVETFHKLEEINKKTPILKKVKYIPSSQKVIYTKYSMLEKIEKKFIIKAIKTNYKDLEIHLQKLEKDEQINILDFLLSYEKYLLIKNPEVKDKKILKNKLLYLRLLLPIKENKKIKIKEKKSPAMGNKPMILGSSFTSLSKIGSYPTLDFSIFAIESLGQNSLNFNELIVGNTSIAYKPNSKENLFINEFSLIKIKKLNRTALDWEESFNPSWRLNIGSKLIEKNSKTTNDIFINAGIGKTFEISENITSYYILDASVHSKFPYITVKPNINFDFDFNKLKNSLEFGYEVNPYNKNTNEYLKVSAQYKVLDNFSIAISHENSSYSKSNVNLKWFF
ncbi:Lnb N-terminal periplasmic domain-containing protein [Arcobacter peruensis]|uniref:Lnb N-terminal periplasmic domain-containing protein n=1 Tax=Arcobacter peruensis TaxID=2320140 RepID=UPI000F079202|nr:DUF4105 domain-containing protein [Arcobacter peruensis]